MEKAVNKYFPIHVYINAYFPTCKREGLFGKELNVMLGATGQGVSLRRLIIASSVVQVCLDQKADGAEAVDQQSNCTKLIFNGKKDIPLCSKVEARRN